MIRTALYQVGKNWAVGARDKSMLLAQEAQQVLAKTSERVSKPKFTFGPKSPAALSKVSATEALSRQNKTFHFGTSKSYETIDSRVLQYEDCFKARSK